MAFLFFPGCLNNSPVIASIIRILLPEAACLSSRLPENVLNLCIDAAQLIIGPFLQDFIQSGIEPQQQAFFGFHE
jgi:hypothetical protein